MSASGKPRAGVALVIGISNYQRHEQIPALPFAAEDARALYRMLTNSDVCGFPEGRVELLTDEKAHKDEIIRRLAHWLPTQASGAELVVLYFAGHGTVARVGATDEGLRGQLHGSLRDRLLASPLCDGRGFTRGLEEVYRRLWRR